MSAIDSRRAFVPLDKAIWAARQAVADCENNMSTDVGDRAEELLRSQAHVQREAHGSYKVDIPIPQGATMEDVRGVLNFLAGIGCAKVDIPENKIAFEYRQTSLEDAPPGNHDFAAKFASYIIKNPTKFNTKGGPR